MKITNYNEPKDKSGPLKASFMAYDPEYDLTLEMKYFEKNDGSSWFSYPSIPYTGKEGEKKYKWTAFFGEKGKKRWEERIKAALANRNQEELPF